MNRMLPSFRKHPRGVNVCVLELFFNIPFLHLSLSLTHSSQTSLVLPPAPSPSEVPSATSATLQQQQLKSSCTQSSLSQNQTLHFKGHFSCGGHDARLGGFHRKLVSFPLSWKRNNLRVWI